MCRLSADKQRLFSVMFVTSIGLRKLELSYEVIKSARIYAETLFFVANFDFSKVASIVVANKHRRQLAVRMAQHAPINYYLLNEKSSKQIKYNLLYTQTIIAVYMIKKHFSRLSQL